VEPEQQADDGGLDAKAGDQYAPRRTVMRKV
jgi:hypothetical protein